MSIIRRPQALVAVALALLAGGGCTIHRSEYGWCFGPMFRLERNRPGCGHGHGRDCNCANGEMEVAKPVEYEGGPVTVETQPLQMLGGEIVNGTVIGGEGATQAYPAPAGAPSMTRVFPESTTQPQGSQPPANDGAQKGPQQSKKNRPGALSVQMGSYSRDKLTPLAPGATTDVFILFENTGDDPIQETTADVLLSANLRAVEIKRTEGSGLQGSYPMVATNALLENGKVVLDRLTNLKPETKIEYVLKVRALPNTSGAATVKVSASSSALEKGKPLEKTLPLVIQ